MGKIISFTGVDGSGKTTVAHKVIKNLKKRDIEIKYHHELNFYVIKSIYKTLRKVPGLKKSSDRFKKGLLTRVHNLHPLVSFFYYNVIFFDNLLTYFYFKIQPNLVLSDRWLYDYLAGFKVRGYKNSYIEWLFKQFPKPDIYILFSVDPKVAMKRKKHDVLHVNDKIDFYKKMDMYIVRYCKKLGADRIIDTDRPVKEITQEVVDYIKHKI